MKPINLIDHVGKRILTPKEVALLMPYLHKIETELRLKKRAANRVAQAKFRKNNPGYRAKYPVDQDKVKAYLERTKEHRQELARAYYQANRVQILAKKAAKRRSQS